MAKQKRQPSDFPEAPAGTQDAPAPEAAVEEGDTAPAGASRKYRVSLNCPTPVEHRELVVEAGNEEQAKAAYCEANGICDSHHEWKIERA